MRNKSHNLFIVKLSRFGNKLNIQFPQCSVTLITSPGSLTVAGRDQELSALLGAEVPLRSHIKGSNVTQCGKMACQLFPSPNTTCQLALVISSLGCLHLLWQPTDRQTDIRTNKRTNRHKSLEMPPVCHHNTSAKCQGCFPSE